MRYGVTAIAVLGLAGCPKKAPAPVAEPAGTEDIWFGGSAGTPDICIANLEDETGPMTPEDRAAWLAGAEALKIADVEGAGAALDRASAEPTHPSITAAKALQALIAGEGAVADTTYTELIAAYPDDVCLLQTGAFVALQTGDSVTSRARIEHARELAPDHPDVMWLTFALSMEQDPVAAEAELLAFEQAHPKARLIEVTLASLAIGRGDIAAAVPYLETLDGMGEPVGDYLIDAYRALGRTGDVLKYWSRSGAPLGDDGKIALAADPQAAYYEVLGMHEGDRLVATIQTTNGTLTCELFPESAPLTVANFVGLSRGTIQWADPVTGVPRTDPLYPNTAFHRVIPEFMIQGGDPAGDGTGGPGYAFADEIDPERAFDKPGVLAMANSGPGTNGSQWFVTEVPTQYLTGRHTIFGQCDEASVGVVKAIARVPVGPLDKPTQPVRIESIEIRAEAAGPG